LSRLTLRCSAAANGGITFMTTKRKLMVSGISSLVCLAASALSLVALQIVMANSWGTQVQLLAFRPWTGKMLSTWDALVPLCGYAVSLFLFAAIILSLIFGWTFFRNRRAQGQAHAP
jgi:hypothetical protein